jgi:hypothetical protein
VRHHPRPCVLGKEPLEFGALGVDGHHVLQNHGAPRPLVDVPCTGASAASMRVAERQQEHGLLGHPKSSQTHPSSPSTTSAKVHNAACLLHAGTTAKASGIVLLRHSSFVLSPAVFWDVLWSTVMYLNLACKSGKAGTHIRLQTLKP